MASAFASAFAATTTATSRVVELAHNATTSYAHHLELFSSSWTQSPPKLSTALPLALLGLLIFRSIVVRIWRWYALRHVPGPFLAKFTSLWLTWHAHRRSIHETFARLKEQYGPLVRIGPNEVLCTDVAELHRISSVKAGYTKHAWYKFGQMKPGVDSVFTTIDPEERREKKRKITPAYAGKGTDSFEEGIDRGVAGLLESIQTRYADKEGVAMDLTRQLHYAALDTLGEVAYSTPLGFLKNNRDMGNFIQINDKILPIMFILSEYTSFFKMMHHWPFSYLLPREGDAVGAGAVLGFTTSLVDDRLRGKTKPSRDILQSFIRNGLTREELLQEVTIQFFAGSDTTANLMTFTLFYLLTSPTAYRQLQSEIDVTNAKGLLSTPMQDSEVRQLSFLQTCILETLRMHPPLTSMQFYKAPPPQGDTLCGYRVPGHARVATNTAVYAICRDKSFWGANVKEFRPDRWFGVDAERREAMKMRVDLAFGHGQFACLGKAIALMEASKAIAEIFRRFDLALIDPLKPLDVTSCMAWMIHDFHVRVRSRNNELASVKQG